MYRIILKICWVNLKQQVTNGPMLKASIHSQSLMPKDTITASKDPVLPSGAFDRFDSFFSDRRKTKRKLFFCFIRNITKRVKTCFQHFKKKRPKWVSRNRIYRNRQTKCPEDFILYIVSFAMSKTCLITITYFYFLILHFCVLPFITCSYIW